MDMQVTKKQFQRFLIDSPLVPVPPCSGQLACPSHADASPSFLYFKQSITADCTAEEASDVFPACMLYSKPPHSAIQFPLVYL